MDFARNRERAWLNDCGESSIIGARHHFVAGGLRHFYDVVHGFHCGHVGGLVGIDLLSEIMMDRSKAPSINFSDLRAAMSKIPKFDFLSKKENCRIGISWLVF